MNPESEEVVRDGMSVHPDWNHIETLTIHPNCDTLIIVPGHALFRSGVDVKSPGFDPTNVNYWSLNEFQDAYELRLLLDHIKTGVLAATQIANSILVFSGGCTRLEGDGWTEGESYYAIADYYDWWQRETHVPLFLMKAKAFVEMYACDSFDNLFMSLRLFQMVHPHKHVPKKVIVVGYGFKKKRFELHAQTFEIPSFEYLVKEDPVNYAVDPMALQREAQVLASYKEDPFAEQLDSVVGRKRLKRQLHGLEYPYGTPREVLESYRRQFQKRKSITHSQ